MMEELLKRRVVLVQKIHDLESELNEEKDNEDTWGGHDGPGYMDTEAELKIRVELLKDLDRQIARIKLANK